MIFILLCIVLTTGLFLFFRIYKQDLRLPLIINYLVAGILGLTLSIKTWENLDFGLDFIITAFLCGVLFVAGFWWIGKSTRIHGIALTTSSSRMGFLIPVVAGLGFMGETLSAYQYFAVVLGIPAVYLLAMQKKKAQSQVNTGKIPSFWILPAVWLISGSIDLCLKIAQHFVLRPDAFLLFLSWTFFIAFGISLLIFYPVLFQSQVKKTKAVTGGVLLGALNFFASWALLQSLDKSGLPGSVIFPSIHISVLTLAVFAGIFIFNERPNYLHWIGIVLGIISISLLFNF